MLLPLSVLLLFELFERLVAPRRVAALLVAATAIHVAFYASLTVTGVTIFRPSVASAFGRDAGLAFVPPSVAVCEFANQSLSPADHRILFVGETRSYPCGIPFDFWNGHFRHPFEHLRADETPEVRWERHVHERGATHLIYSPQVARKRMEWSPRMHARFERWLERRGRLLVAHENRESTTRLYALTPQRSSTGEPPAVAGRAGGR